MARPNEFHVYQNSIIKHIKKFGDVAAAAEAHGFARVTVYAAMRRDELFMSQVIEAKKFFETKKHQPVRSI